MNWKTEETKQLVKAFLCLEKPGEARRFLRDLMTEQEIIEFAKRLQTAQLLSKKVPYLEITQKTGFSSTTIARVSRWLFKGKNGYSDILSKLHHHNPSNLGEDCLHVNP